MSVRTLITRRMQILSVSIAVMLILAVILVFSLSWSTLRILAQNNDADHYRIRVAVSIDGDLKATGDVHFMEAVTLGDWTVKAGSHLVEVNFDYPDDPLLTDLENPPEWTENVKVGLFSTKSLLISFPIFVT